jgi:hypothetical protein
MISLVEAKELSPMLNIGSQNAGFQRQTPWINDNIFTPLKNRGVNIINSDIQNCPGVDLVGDFLDLEFQKSVATKNFKSIVCCNVLEHVNDIDGFVDGLKNVLSPASYLIISCPCKFPYHPDPIDNQFRPTPSELTGLFPKMEIIGSGCIPCETGWEYLFPNKSKILIKLARLAFPFIRPKGWIETVRMLGWLNQRFSASCALLRQTGS